MPFVSFCFLKQLQRFNVQVRYGMAKLATLLLAQEVDRRVGSFGVYSNAVHPGVVASDPLVCKWFLWTLKLKALFEEKRASFSEIRKFVFFFVAEIRNSSLCRFLSFFSSKLLFPLSSPFLPAILRHFEDLLRLSSFEALLGTFLGNVVFGLAQLRNALFAYGVQEAEGGVPVKRVKRVRFCRGFVVDFLCCQFLRCEKNSCQLEFLVFFLFVTFKVVKVYSKLWQWASVRGCIEHPFLCSIPRDWGAPAACRLNWFESSVEHCQNWYKSRKVEKSPERSHGSMKVLDQCYKVPRCHSKVSKMLPLSAQKRPIRGALVVPVAQPWTPRHVAALSASGQGGQELWRFSSCA